MESLKFVSYTSNLREQMFDFRRYIRFSPMLISNLQHHQQSLSLGTVAIDNDEPYHPHDNITREMNVRNQTSQAFVTISGQVCDCSIKFIHRPKNVRSTKPCHMHAFRRFQFLLLATVVVEARSGDFVQLLRLRQLAISFNALSRMTFHIV